LDAVAGERCNRSMTNESLPDQTMPDAAVQDVGAQLPDPAVQVAGAEEIAPDLLAIPNHRVDLVPNIGIIGGTQAVLVVDTGIGTATPSRSSPSRQTSRMAAGSI